MLNTAVLDEIFSAFLNISTLLVLGEATVTLLWRCHIFKGCCNGNNPAVTHSGSRSGLADSLKQLGPLGRGGLLEFHLVPC